MKVPGNESLCPSPPSSTNQITFVHLIEDDICLPHRMVCGIESTALANPDASVHLHLVSWKVDRSQKDTKFIRPGKANSCDVTDVLKQSDNIHINVDSHSRRLLNDSR